MSDTANTAYEPHEPNHSLNRRRDERATEQFAQDGVNRLSEIAACNMEVFQKQTEVMAQLTRLWADAFTTTQKTISQFTDQIQNRRSA
jgi:hypothetical protein